MASDDIESRTFFEQVCLRDLAALQVADKSYPLAKRSIFYQLGRNLLSENDFAGALTAFEKAIASPLLIELILEKKGKAFRTQYLEDNPDLRARLEGHKNPATFAKYSACCELSTGPDAVSETVKQFSSLGFVDKALELALDAQLDSELIQLALRSNCSQSVLRVARYFEYHPLGRFLPQAALLYDKGGYQTKAIKICIENKLYPQLSSIMEHASSDNVNEELIKKCKLLLETVQE